MDHFDMLRVPAADEIRGLDEAYHGGKLYSKDTITANTIVAKAQLDPRLLQKFKK